ncbi:MAG: hypothetical protein H7A48_05935 [Akkermansiaceae bacterium]|nr:hypothetical protein [Akkermansiaceae bacterium]
MKNQRLHPPFLPIGSPDITGRGRANTTVRQYKMQQFMSLVIALAGLFAASCASHKAVVSSWDSSLDADLMSCKPIMYEFDLKKMAALKERLLTRMHEVGDDSFAAAIERQSDDVRTEICNTIGLLEESKYDGFPKTRYQLSAAPKI